MLEKREGHPLHILVIDDDPMFRAQIRKAGLTKGIEVTCCSNLRELDPMNVDQLFDIVIVDYYLDHMKENLTGARVAWALESTPIVMVSSSDHCVEKAESWPASIRKFVNKDAGPLRIVEAAIQVASTSETEADKQTQTSTETIELDTKGWRPAGE